MEVIASKRQWNVYALDRILTSPLSLPANNMLELGTNCGWKALVYETLLCHHSTYYEAAIHGKFQEANSDHFDLGLDKSCAEWFVRWLYSGQLSGPDACAGTEELVRLYIFADEKDILALRRDVMTTLMKFDPCLPYCDVALVTNSLPQSAPLYRYAIELYVHHWFPDENDPCQQGQAYEVMPKEFLYLVMSALALRPQLPDNGTKPSCACCGPPCRFHEHESYKEWRETCFRSGGAKLSDCPEELKPKKSNET